MYNEGTGWVVIEAELEKRQSRLIRQIEEGVYNIKPEDYDETGDLKIQVHEENNANDKYKNNMDMPFQKYQDFRNEPPEVYQDDVKI